VAEVNPVPYHHPRFRTTALVLALVTPLRADVGQPALAGRVTTPAGEPAAGARVWLADPALDPMEPAETCAETTCDADGRFSIAVPAERLTVPGRHAVELYVVGEGGAIRAESFPAAELPIGQPLDFPLPPRVAGAFRVTDSQGTALAGARVRPRTLLADSGAALVLPEELQDLLAVTADASSVAHPDLWSPDRATAVVVEHGSLGAQVLANVRSEGGWIVAQGVQLAAVGPVRVAIEGEGPSIPLELHAVSNHQVRFAPPTVGLLRARARLRSDARSVELAGFESAARVEARSDDPAVLRLAWRWDGVEEGVGRTTLTWSAGTLVHGRVIESRTGVPVSGVRLRATTGNATTTVVTDDEGSYHLLCAPGRLSLNYATPPTARHLWGEFSPEHAHVTIPADVGELALPDWVLLVDDPVHGQVVAEDGSARPGVWISASLRVPVGATFETQTTHAFSDAEGRFVLHGVNLGVGSARIEARLGTARAQASYPAVGERSELRLVLPRR